MIRVEPRLYPNGEANVNDSNRVVGTAFLLRALLNAGHMHDDVDTVIGSGLSQYTQALTAKTRKLTYMPAVAKSADLTVLRPFAEPFSAEGELRLLRGNLGQAIVKVSAVAPEHRVITSPAHVFDAQVDAITAFKANRFVTDSVLIVRSQGRALAACRSCNNSLRRCRYCWIAD